MMKSNDNTDWTEERSLKLIEEYRLRPVLWDKKDPFHNNVTFFNEAWLDISNCIGRDPSSCMAHMSSLVQQFYDKMKDIFATPGGRGTTDWFAWSAMSFLHFKEYEKIKLLTGNHYYSETLENEMKRFKQFSIAETPSRECFEELDENLKNYLLEIGAKIKDYPQEFRTRIIESINDILNLAEEEFKSNSQIDLTDV